jgi:hypothetical protein
MGVEGAADKRCTPRIPSWIVSCLPEKDNMINRTSPVYHVLHGVTSPDSHWVEIREYASLLTARRGGRGRGRLSDHRPSPRSIRWESPTTRLAPRPGPFRSERRGSLRISPALVPIPRSPPKPGAVGWTRPPPPQSSLGACLESRRSVLPTTRATNCPAARWVVILASVADIANVPHSRFATFRRSARLSEPRIWPRS